MQFSDQAIKDRINCCHGSPLWALSTVQDCAQRPQLIGHDVLLERPSALVFWFLPPSASTSTVAVLLKSKPQGTGSFLLASDKFSLLLCRIQPKYPAKTPKAYYAPYISSSCRQQQEKSFHAPLLPCPKYTQATRITLPKSYTLVHTAARPPPCAKGASRGPIQLPIHVVAEEIKTSPMRLPAPRSSTTAASARPKRQRKRNRPAHIPDQSFHHDYLGLLGLRVLSIDTDDFCVRVRAEQYPLFEKCPECGCADKRFKCNGTRIQIVRDEPRGMRSVYVEIVRQSYYCRGCETAFQHPLPRNR